MWPVEWSLLTMTLEVQLRYGSVSFFTLRYCYVQARIGLVLAIFMARLDGRDQLDHLPQRGIDQPRTI